jgi:hypothetical protein
LSYSSVVYFFCLVADLLLSMVHVTSSLRFLSLSDPILWILTSVSQPLTPVQKMNANTSNRHTDGAAVTAFCFKHRADRGLTSQTIDHRVVHSGEYFQDRRIGPRIV